MSRSNRKGDTAGVGADAKEKRGTEHGEKDWWQEQDTVRGGVGEGLWEERGGGVVG